MISEKFHHVVAGIASDCGLLVSAAILCCGFLLLWLLINFRLRRPGRASGMYSQSPFILATSWQMLILCGGGLRISETVTLDLFRPFLGPLDQALRAAYFILLCLPDMRNLNDCHKISKRGKAQWLTLVPGLGFTLLATVRKDDPGGDGALSALPLLSNLVLLTIPLAAAVLSAWRNRTGSWFSSIPFLFLVVSQLLAVLAISLGWPANDRQLHWVAGANFLFYAHVPLLLARVQYRSSIECTLLKARMRDLTEGFSSTLGFIAYSGVPDLQRSAQSHSLLAREIASYMRLPQNEEDDVHTAYLLRDIGMVTLDRSVITAPRRLMPDEWASIRRHPDQGERIVRMIAGLESVAAIVRSHHENWDGTGYPDGVSGERIPRGARIIGLVDTFAAMTEGRSYRSPFSLREAIEEVLIQSGRRFDPEVVKVFIRLLRDKGYEIG